MELSDRGQVLILDDACSASIRRSLPRVISSPSRIQWLSEVFEDVTTDKTLVGTCLL